MRRRIFTIDAARFTSPEEAHAVMKRVFRRYEYYGNNLDALHDVLTSIRRDTTIRLIGLDASRARLDCYADRIKEVFLDSAEENPHLTLELFEPENA